MALQDTLIIKNNLTPKQTLKNFFAVGSVEPKIRTKMITKDIKCYIAEFENLFLAYSAKPFTTGVYTKSIDLYTNVRIDLDIYNLDSDKARNIIIKMGLSLAVKTSWEFALYHDDPIIMVYKGHQLVLNKLAQFWKKQENLKMITLPYVFSDIPY